MAQPVFVYDDDCGFCTWWAEVFDDYADVRIVGFSDLDEDLRDRLPEEYESCSHFVTPEAVQSCGASIEAALLRTAPGQLAIPIVEFLRDYGWYHRAREWAYRRGANNRDRLGRLLSKSPPAQSLTEDSPP
jgi:hypothetical protein